MSLTTSRVTASAIELDSHAVSQRHTPIEPFVSARKQFKVSVMSAAVSCQIVVIHLFEGAWLNTPLEVKCLCK